MEECANTRAGDERDKWREGVRLNGANAINQSKEIMFLQTFTDFFPMVHHTDEFRFKKQYN